MRQRDEDAELMLALGRGEVAAFDALFERWGARLLRYLRRLVSDAATAEELVQETFLRLYRAREGYEAESRFSTWLYRIATNLALNELRRPRRKQPHASIDDDAAPIELVAHGAGPESHAQTRLKAAALQRELDRLPDRQRVALWLSAVEGQSYAEVARTLKTTEKSVKSLVHRARVSLAARLPQETGCPPAASGAEDTAAGRAPERGAVSGSTGCVARVGAGIGAGKGVGKGAGNVG